MKIRVKSLKQKPRYLMVVSGNFDDELYQKTTELLSLFLSKRDNYSGITIFITSLGGSAHIGLALYDLLKSINTSIYTVALGECTSSATLLFSLGEKRFIGKNTVCLIHSISMDNDGYSNARDINELYSRMKLYNSKMLDVYKRTKGVTEEYLNFINDVFYNIKEVTLSPEELLKYNFATNMYVDLKSVM